MENVFVCPLCKFAEIKQYPMGGLEGVDYRIDCQRCGQFFVTTEFLQYSEKTFFDQYGYILSGLSRENNESGARPLVFTFENKEKYLKHYLVPDVSDIDAKIIKFLRYIKSKTEWYGKWIKYRPSLDYSVTYAKNKHEFKSLIHLLVEAHYIETEQKSPADKLVDSILDVEYVKLTAEGWRKASQLEENNQSSEQGFIAIWFDPEGSMDDSALAIEEAIREADFKPMCIKGEHFSERIMDKALGEIRKSRFVVVDLTGARPSVFFEAGFAFGLKVEAIYVYRKGEEGKSSLEFYVKHYQCHAYESSAQLKEIVRNAINGRIKS